MARWESSRRLTLKCGASAAISPGVAWLGQAGYSAGVQWLAGSLLLTGVLAQSGGFFLHMGLGQQGSSSPGTALTRIGALLIAALIILAIGLITHG
jgi:hypothetical protein